jgi:hypothetical protein
MADQLQLRGGTTTEHNTFTGASKEVTIDTTKKTAVVHDGATAGGNPLMREDGANSALALGSASSPSLKWDADTGLYSPGANQVAISTSGSGRLFVASDGKVGIGTASPGSPLTIESNAGDQVKITYPSIASYYLNATSGGDFAINKDGTERLRITSDGNLGLGTSTPDLALTVNGGFNLRNSTRAGAFEISSDGDLWMGTATTLGNIYFETGHSTTGLPSTGTAKMTISSTGVGIGTTTVSDKLHIGGGNICLSYADGSTGLRNKISWRTESPYFGEVAYIAVDRTASSFAPTDIVFATGTSAGVSEKARLDSSGRLLVGTSSDQSESDATGLIQAFHSSAGKIIIGREDSTVSTGDYIGIIDFRSTDGGSQRTARIAAQADGDHGANDKPGRLVFSTTADGASSPTERFRINKNGILYSANHSVHLGVEGSTMSGGGRFTVHGDFYSGTAGAAFSTTNNTNGAIYIQFGNSTGTKIGSITRASSTSVAYNTTSDYRLKENVLPIQAATQLISQLRPVSYNFIGHADEQSTGFIAHELQEVIPEAVTGEKDAAHADGSPNYQGVDLSKLVPLLTAALQEALAEIESLKARVTALEP